MLLKKFYIPIGALIIAICAVGLFSLRSDTPTEPIKIYKATTPAEKAETQTDTTTRDTAQGGHFHADGTFHAEPHSEETAVSTSETAVSTSEFTRAELLERFPQYDFHSPESKENLHSILRGEKEQVRQEARIAELKRQLAEQEALETLVSYLQSSAERLDSEYSDVMAFYKTYRDPDIEDFIREYPDETERRAFMLRTLEASKIRQAMADRILETPAADKHLPPEFVDELVHLASIDIDKIIGGAK